jgi:hypothetical protein
MSVIELFREPAPSNGLVRALKALLDAPSKEEASAVLIREQALLLTDPAFQMMRRFWQESMRDNRFNENDLYDDLYIGYHYVLLIAFYKHGSLSKAWEEADKQVGMGRTREQLKHYTREFLRDLNRS